MAENDLELCEEDDRILTSTMGVNSPYAVEKQPVSEYNEIVYEEKAGNKLR